MEKPLRRSGTNEMRKRSAYFRLVARCARRDSFLKYFECDLGHHCLTYGRPIRSKSVPGGPEFHALAFSDGISVAAYCIKMSIICQKLEMFEKIQVRGD